MAFFAGIAHRSNTRAAYSSQQRIFVRLCASLGVDARAGPLNERQLCLVTILYARAHKITTVPTFLSAVASLAHESGFGPLPRGPFFARVRAGLDNYYGRDNAPERRDAITLADLELLRSRLQPRATSQFADARDWCAAVFAFFGLLRISEYAGARGLRVADVRAETWGVELTVQFSKTALLPTTVSLASRTDGLCPLAALRTYAAHFRHARAADAPFLSMAPCGRVPMDKQLFCRRIRLLLVTPQRPNTSNIAGHSFRRGGATAMAQAGVPEAHIAAHGRWRSLAYRSYFDRERDPHLRLLPTRALISNAASPAVAAASQ